MAKKILRLKEVKTRTGLGRSTIYLRIAQGSFPKSIALGERAVGWLESDLDEWINERIRQSRQVGRHD
jgi:prophage regulatory protein